MWKTHTTLDHQLPALDNLPDYTSSRKPVDMAWEYHALELGLLCIDVAQYG
jgi:hypothetical protein